MTGPVMTGPVTTGQQAPVLYVLKRFPRLSETFILRELLALETAGETLLVDALLPPEDEPRHPELAGLRARVRWLPRHPHLADRAVAGAHLRVAARAPATWLRLAGNARRAGTWRRFVQAGLVADRVRRDGVRHVHAHFATAAAEVARDAGALAGVPVTVTAHAKDVFHQDNAPLLAGRLRGVAAVVTVSEHNADHLRTVLPGVPIHLVRNALALRPARAPASYGPILCVCRLVPKKGVDCLLEAFAQLGSLRPALRLELIGGGPLQEQLQAQAIRLGIGDRVDFLGPQPSSRVEEALRRCAVLALPCRIDGSGDRDGLPTVLVEALAGGTPVVTTDILGLPELVRHGHTGLLVPPDDPAALAAAIGKLLDDPVLAAGLGAAGRELVARDYDPGRSAAGLKQVWAQASR